ncbi:hypothetical protein [Azospirillum brasilense]|uniref:hypothetical protein n=1 Tax=Azospirillum brasilense TaxID=192 RepID=UPI0011C3D03E|nr:hypothetical protein [Azospirillum brasilense]NUB25110.1 hypothetical protein [Azospirillum brasilense]NUB30566.1 hypothetical protein [Azospirillum brasilense]
MKLEVNLSPMRLSGYPASTLNNSTSAATTNNGNNMKTSTNNSPHYMDAARDRVIVVAMMITIVMSIISIRLISLWILNNLHDVFFSFTVSQKYFVFAAVLIGFFLYGVRARFPMFYGVMEIYFGAFSITIATPTTVSAESISSTRALAILGGMYIIVRGLDNIHRGAPPLIRKSMRVIRFGVDDKD